MTNELCTNMRNHHLCVPYIIRGYSNQILLGCSIIRMVSSFMHLNGNLHPPPQKNKKNKKQNSKTKTKQIDKQRQKPKKKKMKTILCNISRPFNITITILY